MQKWYEDKRCEEGPVIGGQVCLVRNIAGYPFSEKMEPDQKKNLREEVENAVCAEEAGTGSQFHLIELSDEKDDCCNALIGTQTVPPLMFSRTAGAALLVTDDESVSILINGQEHLCIQVSIAGNRIQEALAKANRIDDLLNRHLTYAYSSRYGYLTASPLYTGTGMSASYLIHLHYLERAQLIAKYQKEYSQFGFTLHGCFRGKNAAPGRVYRLKNCRTLGLSENEVISSLKQLASQLEAQEEKSFRLGGDEEKEYEIDQIYRAYGVLRYARDLDYEETLVYLSYLRAGQLHGILKEETQAPVTAMMFGIHDAVLEKRISRGETMKDSVRRAQYLRDVLPQIDPA